MMNRSPISPAPQPQRQYRNPQGLAEEDKPGQRYEEADAQWTEVRKYDLELFSAKRRRKALEEMV